MKIYLFTIVFIIISSIHAQTRKTIQPNKYFPINVTVKSSDASTLVTMDAAATSPVDMYIMNPVQFVEYSILASKGVEFEYDKENSRIGVKQVELKNVEIYEHGSKIVMFNPGNSILTITYNIETKGRQYEPGKLNSLLFVIFFDSRI